MRTKEFPVKPLERIAKKSGVKRISSGGAQALRNLVFEISENIAQDIVALAKHSERTTVQKRDVDFVVKRRITP